MIMMKRLLHSTRTPRFDQLIEDMRQTRDKETHHVVYDKGLYVLRIFRNAQSCKIQILIQVIQ